MNSVDKPKRQRKKDNSNLRKDVLVKQHAVSRVNSLQDKVNQEHLLSAKVKEEISKQRQIMFNLEAQYKKTLQNIYNTNKEINRLINKYRV